MILKLRRRSALALLIFLPLSWAPSGLNTPAWAQSGVTQVEMALAQKALDKLTQTYKLKFTGALQAHKAGNYSIKIQQQTAAPIQNKNFFVQNLDNSGRIVVLSPSFPSPNEPQGGGVQVDIQIVDATQLFLYQAQKYEELK